MGQPFDYLNMPGTLLCPLSGCSLGKWHRVSHPEVNELYEYADTSERTTDWSMATHPEAPELIRTAQQLKLAVCPDSRKVEVRRRFRRGQEHPGGD